MCLIGGCKKSKIYARGICRYHYNMIFKLVAKNVRNWEEFERFGMVEEINEDNIYIRTKKKYKDVYTKCIDCRRTIKKDDPRRVRCKNCTRILRRFYNRKFYSKEQYNLDIQNVDNLLE